MSNEPTSTTSHSTQPAMPPGGSDFTGFPITTLPLQTPSLQGNANRDWVARFKALFQLPGVIKELQSQETKYLPAHRLTSSLFLAISKDPALRYCTEESWLRCARSLIQVGLEPDGIHDYVIAYGNEAKVSLSYRGIIVIGNRNGITGISTELVYEHDPYIRYRDENGLHFRHQTELALDRGRVIGAYCVWKLNGEADSEVVGIEELEAIRKRSPSGGSSAWKDYEGEMFKKIAVKRGSKRWPLESSAAELIQADGEGTEWTVTSSQPAPTPTRKLFGAGPEPAPVQALQPELAQGHMVAVPRTALTGQPTKMATPAPPQPLPQESAKRGPGRPRKGDSEGQSSPLPTASAPAPVAIPPSPPSAPPPPPPPSPPVTQPVTPELPLASVTSPDRVTKTSKRTEAHEQLLGLLAQEGIAFEDFLARCKEKGVEELKDAQTIEDIPLDMVRDAMLADPENLFIFLGYDNLT
jgi:phage RecT family recombinase